jgi:hypothetical protein
VIEIALLIVLSILAALAIFVGKLMLSGGDLPVTAEWIEELSLDRYRPMLRLLEPQDLEYLRSQPGFTPRMARKLRMQRYHIFRGYLRSLSMDFRRISAALKLLLLQSREDRPDLAGILLRHQVNFACSLLIVQFRLAFYRLGLGTVSASNLVGIFNRMQGELRELMPAASAAGV